MDWRAATALLTPPFGMRWESVLATAMRLSFCIRSRSQRTAASLKKSNSQPIPGVAATSKSSYRSVVAWRQSGAGSPAILKLSIGAVIGRIRRALRENRIARGVVISSLFDTIPDRDRERLGLDWFPEPAGVAEPESRHGWLGTPAASSPFATRSDQPAAGVFPHLSSRHTRSDPRRPNQTLETEP